MQKDIRNVSHALLAKQHNQRSIRGLILHHGLSVRHRSLTTHWEAELSSRTQGVRNLGFFKKNHPSSTAWEPAAPLFQPRHCVIARLKVVISRQKVAECALPWSCHAKHHHLGQESYWLRYHFGYWKKVMYSDIFRQYSSFKMQSISEERSQRISQLLSKTKLFCMHSAAPTLSGAPYCEAPTCRQTWLLAAHWHGIQAATQGCCRLRTLKIKTWHVEECNNVNDVNWSSQSQTQG